MLDTAAMRDDPSEDEIEAKLTDDYVLWRNEKNHETALRQVARLCGVMHGQLAAFYAKHNAAILTKNKGNEAKLCTELELKYGARP